MKIIVTMLRKLLNSRYVTYTNLDGDTPVRIHRRLLIKPENLHNHIGERLIFHNGNGAISAAILEKADAGKDVNGYQYCHDRDLDYSHEIYMDWLYFPVDDNGDENVISKYDTYQTVYLMRCCGITHDQNFSVMYVARPTDAENHFIDEMMTMDENILRTEYERLDKLMKNESDYSYFKSRYKGESLNPQYYGEDGIKD